MGKVLLELEGKKNTRLLVFEGFRDDTPLVINVHGDTARYSSGTMLSLTEARLLHERLGKWLIGKEANEES